MSHVPTDSVVAALTDSGPIPSLYVRLADPLPLVTGNYNIVHSEPAHADLIARSADLIILQRWFGTAVLRAAERARRRGVPIIYETDDHLLDLPVASKMKFSPELLDNMRAGIAMADLVMCSTERLAAELRPINPRVVVNPNYGLVKSPVDLSGEPHAAIINTDYFKLTDKAPFFRALAVGIVERGYRITFFGDIDPDAKELCLAYPDRVTLTDGFTDNRSKFLDQVAASGVNVGLVPLTRSRDHSFKSDIKFLDFASLGIPTIFNNGEVYDRVRSGIDGLICDDTFRGYVDALACYADPAARALAGKEAQRVVRDHRSIDDYAARLGNWMARLLDGESGDAIAGVTAGPLSSPQPAKGAAGLMLEGSGLFFIAGGARHHIVSSDLTADFLAAGARFIDEEQLPDETVPAGSSIHTSGEARQLVARARNDQPPRKRRDMLRIAWIVPGLVIGSGGHRNIIRCAYQLEQLGHEVGLYFTSTSDSGQHIAQQVRENFYPIEGVVDRFDRADLHGDVVFATHWTTVASAEQVAQRFRSIMYFVQDFEPSFYAMGSEYVLAEDTYRRGYYAITSGVWCEKFLRRQFNARADHFKFPVDTGVYYDRGLSRYNRVVFFAKPEMMRRCFEVGVAALTIFHKLRPDVEIVFFGSKNTEGIELSFPVTHLGLLPTTDDLAVLYASSTLGLVFSTTNPSLVPYEMMACGLPVVDLDRAGNDANYDDRRDIACLAGPDAESLAAALVTLLGDRDQWQRRSAAGQAFASGFPSEEKVGQIIENLIINELDRAASRTVAAMPAGARR